MDAPAGAGQPLPADGDDAPARDADGLTVGRLAARFGLSRSTLLYYDRIGLLAPSARSAAGYRQYSAADEERLAQICRYRKVGLPLTVIQAVVDSQDVRVAAALAARLSELDHEVRRLRHQQGVILAYLQGGAGPSPKPFLTAERFTELLETLGVSLEQRTRWHESFEKADPDEHQAFLEFLCLSDESIEHVRGSAAQPGSGGQTEG